MRELIKRLSILISVCMITLFAICLTSNNGGNNSMDAPIRNIELVENNVDANSYFEKFDSYELNFSDDKADFIGYDVVKLSELYELDLISEETIDNEVLTKYSCTYDYENGVVSLSVSLIEGEEVSIIDTIYGVIIMDEDLNYDVIFDCDGEALLLSEMEEAGMIDNCGFWSKLKKVWNTTAGKIGTIATVAACAVVGTVCAVVPGGQLVTAACIGVAVGSIGGAITAGVATYIQDGKVDWQAVFAYSVAGAVVGGATSAASYGIAAGIKNAVTASKNVASAGKKTFQCPDKLLEHFNKHGAEFGDVCPTVGDYLDGANYVIENGQYVPEMNGYIKFSGANGKANYAFVGLASDGSYITTFGIRSVSDLAKIIPWLVA
jgi:hypothetical protein